MTTRTLALCLAATLALTACGGGGSGLNPFRWFGGGQKAGPATLEPEGGFAPADRRQPIPQLTGARWQPIDGGQMLVVTGIGPTKGWWDAELVSELPTPDGRIRPGPDGILNLIFVASPPAPGTVETGMPADPRVDTITVAQSFSNTQLSQLSGVVVSGGANSLTLRP